jgi:two-component system sensor histidine kinase KdpD
VIGVLEVVGPRHGRSFDDEDERLLTGFVDQAALALERVRLFDEEARSAVLARSDELKSSLLAAVSHDLRTPLATIKASATSLLDPGIAWTDEARAEFLHAIDEETDRLALLVDNLLDLSKIEGGVLRSERAWYDVAELVADVAGRLAATVAAHSFSTDVAPDLPLVRFDYIQIRQVLTNLGENAVKYTPPGTAIVLAARRVPGAIELSVTDRGPGIEATVLPRVFDTFYRGEPSGRVAGSGIGLAICKGLVEANGGQIWAESWRGAGTVVRFPLPLDPDSEQPA